MSAAGSVSAAGRKEVATSFIAVTHHDNAAGVTVIGRGSFDDCQRAVAAEIRSFRPARFFPEHFAGQVAPYRAAEITVSGWAADGTGATPSGEWEVFADGDNGHAACQIATAA